MAINAMQAKKMNPAGMQLQFDPRQQVNLHYIPAEPGAMQ